MEVYFFHFSVCTLQGHKNCGQRWDKQTLQRQNICSRQVCSNDKQIYLGWKKNKNCSWMKKTVIMISLPGVRLATSMWSTATRSGWLLILSVNLSRLQSLVYNQDENCNYESNHQNNQQVIKFNPIFPRLDLTMGGQDCNTQSAVSFLQSQGHLS